MEKGKMTTPLPSLRGHGVAEAIYLTQE